LITAATTQFVQATVIYVQAYNRAQTKFEELQLLLNPSLNTVTFKWWFDFVGIYLHVRYPIWKDFNVQTNARISCSGGNTVWFKLVQMKWSHAVVR